MNWQHVHLPDVPATPWRNGGGVTRELLAWPAAADWQLRISVADIAADGPFSAYPGIERWFAVLEGGAVRLRVGADEHVLEPASAPLRFDGGLAVECRLTAGRTRDFNVMAPPGRATLRKVSGAQRCEVGGAAIVGLYTHAHPARAGSAACTAELAAGTFAWLEMEHAGWVQVEAQAALWMEFRL